MSALSDQLLSIAILVYLVAMICHAVEYALGGSRNRFRTAPGVPARDLVGAGAGVGWGDALTSAAVGKGPTIPSAGSGTGVRAPGSRAALAGRIGVGITVLAALLHLAALVARAVAADRMPWGNMYEYVLSVSFIGVVGWLVVLWKRPAIRRLGLFLTLLMVLLVATAELVLYVPIVPLIPALNSYWFVVHVSTIAISSGLLLLGAVPAVGYLIRSGYEQGRRGFPYPLGRRLPQATGLERLTFVLHAFAFPLFTFAVIAGAIWAEAAWGRSWGWDPKETWAFISWVVYAGYLHARATPSVRRSAATWIALVGFLTMLMNLYGVNIFFEGLHSYGGLD